MKWIVWFGLTTSCHYSLVDSSEDVLDNLHVALQAEEPEFIAINDDPMLPDIAPPGDLPVQSPELDTTPAIVAPIDTSQWDVDESEPVPDAEKVDDWESIPLPLPSTEDLIRDSEALSQYGSDARRELEETEAVANALDESHSVVELAKDSNNLLAAAKLVNGNLALYEIIIFNSDDFDDEKDDVDGASPLVPDP